MHSISSIDKGEYCGISKKKAFGHRTHERERSFIFRKEEEEDGEETYVAAGVKPRNS
jgi:hypothetical protein